MPDPELGTGGAFCGVPVLKGHTHLEGSLTRCEKLCPPGGIKCQESTSRGRPISLPSFLLPRPGLLHRLPSSLSPVPVFLLFLPLASPSAAPDFGPLWDHLLYPIRATSLSGFCSWVCLPPEVPGPTWGSGRLSETRAPALRRSGAQCPPARASGTPSRLRFSSPREPARGHSPGGVGGVRAGEGERCRGRGRGPAAAAGQEEKESGLAQPLPSDALSAHRRPPSPGLSEGEGEIRAGQSHRRPLPVTPTSRSTELGVFIPKLLL